MDHVGSNIPLPDSCILFKNHFKYRHKYSIESDTVYLKRVYSGMEKTRKAKVGERHVSTLSPFLFGEGSMLW